MAANNNLPFGMLVVVLAAAVVLDELGVVMGDETVALSVVVVGFVTWSIRSLTSTSSSSSSSWLKSSFPISEYSGTTMGGEKEELFRLITYSAVVEGQVVLSTNAAGIFR